MNYYTINDLFLYKFSKLSIIALINENNDKGVILSKRDKGITGCMPKNKKGEIIEKFKIIINSDDDLQLYISDNKKDILFKGKSKNYISLFKMH